MEGVAGCHAPPRITEAEFHEPARLVDLMPAAAADDDRERHGQIDGTFHRAVFKASRNRLAQHSWDTPCVATTTFVTRSIGGRSLGVLPERHVLAGGRATR